jgi:hypothetical protein
MATSTILYEIPKSAPLFRVAYFRRYRRKDKKPTHIRHNFSVDFFSGDAWVSHYRQAVTEDIARAEALIIRLRCIGALASCIGACRLLFKEVTGKKLHAINNADIEKAWDDGVGRPAGV